MTHHATARVLMIAACITAGLPAASASAESLLTLDLSEAGGNLTATAWGTVDLNGLSYLLSTGGVGSGTISSTGFRVGPDGPVHGYFGYSGPSAFGGAAGTNFIASSTGDFIALTPFNGRIYLRQTYVSGAPLFGTAVVPGGSYASANITPGTYTWTYGSGEHAGRIVLNIPAPGAAAVLGLAGLVATRRRR